MEQFIKLNSYDKIRKEQVGRYFNMRAIRSFDPNTNLVLLDGCTRPMLIDKESMERLVDAAKEKIGIGEALMAIKLTIDGIAVKQEKANEILTQIANKKNSIF